MPDPAVTSGLHQTCACLEDGLHDDVDDKTLPRALWEA